MHFNAALIPQTSDEPIRTESLAHLRVQLAHLGPATERRVNNKPHQSRHLNLNRACARSAEALSGSRARASGDLETRIYTTRCSHDTIKADMPSKIEEVNSSDTAAREPYPSQGLCADSAGASAFSVASRNRDLMLEISISLSNPMLPTARAYYLTLPNPHSLRCSGGWGSRCGP